MFRSFMRSSSGSFLFIPLSMLLILKIIKIFKMCYHSVVVMWQHMSSVSVMRTVWRRELDWMGWCEKTSESKCTVKRWNSHISSFCDAIRCLLTPSSLSASPNAIPLKHNKCIRKFINCLLQDLTFYHKCTTLNIIKIMLLKLYLVKQSHFKTSKTQILITAKILQLFRRVLKQIGSINT
jgi:hypothetical protein